MTESTHGFDEALISGYLDGELTQAETQRVRLHLEDCRACRRIADELSALRETTMGSTFTVPPDTQWDETPRGRTSRLLRDAGIVIGLAVLLGLAAFVLVELVAQGELAALLFTGGLLLAAGLILASVLMDRRNELKTDRYRRVRK